MTENENNEEYQHIDDLIDYNDFESKDFNLKLSKESDSFNDNITKFYEDHKKNKPNNITNEVQNTNRPISSYKRLNENNNSKKENFNDEINLEFSNRLEMKIELSSIEISEVKYTIARLNTFLTTHGITSNNFCDNLKLLLNFEDFCELFKNIRFDFNNKKEAILLFLYKNNYYTEGYISIESFVKYTQLEFQKEKIEKIEKVKLGFEEENKELNQEFQKVNSEIFEIIKNNQIEENKKNFKLRVKSFYPHKNTQEKVKIEVKNYLTQRPSTSHVIKSDSVMNEKTMRVKLYDDEEKMSMSQKMQNYLRNSLQKKRDEEVSIRESMHKQHNQFLEDCFRKLKELNKMCKELKIPKNYTIFKNQENELKCRVFIVDDTNEDQKFYEINLKALNVEWRMLYKIYLKNLEIKQNIVETNTLSSQKILNTQTSEINNTTINKMEKNQIKKEIEKMLISSIRLKTKLKQQVESLKRNVVIDENLVLQELKKSFKLEK